MSDNLYSCPGCGKTTNAGIIFFDEGWKASCTHCGLHFAIDVREITNDKDVALIQMSQDEFVQLILAMEEGKEAPFCYSENGEGWYGAMYINFLGVKMLGMGGYGQATKMLDVDGFTDEELFGMVDKFVKSYLKEEGLESVYVDGRYVDYKKESVQEGMEATGLTKTCLSCGCEFEFQSASHDGLGWCTTCPVCGGSFDVVLPHSSDRLEDLLGYCRADEVRVKDGYLELKYRCDPEAQKGSDTTDSCLTCPKAGCHKHTAAQDAEMVLNGEKDLYGAD